MGCFITIEGPNGVGKSTFIHLLEEHLLKYKKVYTTKEPSTTSFGKYVQSNEGNLSGKSYAHLIAADRCYHIENFIMPNLKKYDIVLCDRYIESSLVLQYYDGVDLDYIWDLNKTFLVPDISLILTANIQVIEKRLNERQVLTAFEKRMTRKMEIELYLQAADFLKKKGFNIFNYTNNSKEDAIVAVEYLVDLIKSWEDKNER